MILGVEDVEDLLEIAAEKQDKELQKALKVGPPVQWRGDFEPGCPPGHLPRLSDIVSDPKILGGTSVFTGTRVPVQALVDYLEAGQSLADFLHDFPTVTREQAIAALEAAKRALTD